MRGLTSLVIILVEGGEKMRSREARRKHVKNDGTSLFGLEAGGPCRTQKFCKTGYGKRKGRKETAIDTDQVFPLKGWEKRG